MAFTARWEHFPHQADIAVRGLGATLAEKIGVGLHVGMAVMGHVGASDRHDYSAIGDVTNTASRIEGLTKAAGFPIVCSKAVYEALGCPEDFHALGEKAVKGRSAIEVFGVNAS